MDSRNSPIVAKVIFILIVVVLGGTLVSKMVGDTTDWFTAPIIRALAPSVEVDGAPVRGHAAAVLLRYVQSTLEFNCSQRTRPLVAFSISTHHFSGTPFFIHCCTV
jgi:hypothetical protein